MKVVDLRSSPCLPLANKSESRASSRKSPTASTHPSIGMAAQLINSCKEAREESPNLWIWPKPREIATVPQTSSQYLTTIAIGVSRTWCRRRRTRSWIFMKWLRRRPRSSSAAQLLMKSRNLKVVIWTLLALLLTEPHLQHMMIKRRYTWKWTLIVKFATVRTSNSRPFLIHPAVLA